MRCGVRPSWIHRAFSLAVVQWARWWGENTHDWLSQGHPLCVRGLCCGVLRMRRLPFSIFRRRCMASGTQRAVSYRSARGSCCLHCSPSTHTHIHSSLTLELSGVPWNLCSVPKQFRCVIHSKQRLDTEISFELFNNLFCFDNQQLRIVYVRRARQFCARLSCVWFDNGTEVLWFLYEKVCFGFVFWFLHLI